MLAGGPDTTTAEPVPAAATAARGGATMAGARALGIALSLVSAPILVHHLGVAGFGRYTTVTALIGLVGTSTEAGLLAIALREYAVQHGEGRTLVMRHLLGIRLAVTVTGVLVALAFGIVAGYDDVRVLGILAAGTGLVLLMVQSLLTVPLQAGGRFGRVSALELLRQVLAVAGILALVLAGSGLGPFFLVPVVAAAAVLAVTIRIVRPTQSLRPTVAPRAWGGLLRDTFPFAIATAIYAAYFRVAIIVMSVRSSAIETGLFATSYRVVEVLLALPAIAVTATYPVLARAERDDHLRFERASVRMVELALIAGVATALGLVLAAPLIIDLLAPADGLPAVAVLRIQAPSMIATFVAMACVFPLLTLRRSQAILIANAVAFVAALALTVSLVDSHGARGAATATTIAEFLLAAVIVVLLRREIPSLARVARLLGPVALAGAAGAAVLAIPGVPPVLDTLVGLAAFITVLAGLGQLPHELTHLRRSRGS
ncbi:MAG: hypothetical protein QOG68_2052 [Solirubrobacteraceae bacterium]|nr:hypothetical protein [Solirubrobacteraceae bacterium]